MLPDGYGVLTTYRRMPYVAWLYACRRGHYNRTLSQRALMTFVDKARPLAMHLPPELAHHALIRALQFMALLERKPPRGYRRPSRAIWTA